MAKGYFEYCNANGLNKLSRKSMGAWLSYLDASGEYELLRMSAQNTL